MLLNTSVHLKAMIVASTSQKKMRKLQQVAEEIDFILKLWANIEIPEGMVNKESYG